ncbi:TetR/AcrR family transcriptional regulator [Chryseolinea soli]|uniref:TetR/AcrR family transcriptional regulator n=1 Tax=Chryseolinea soli TaxID=2321403 RepID=A0A385SV40_9BACT|nr:TetR/AcrR family transcriptional regulator [Chryseolinea soli]AYB32648.1 TetR/AcrR family transcriptional regulator [Chryseolinea soli]
MEKDHILAGCGHLFGKWGFHGVTMDDISRHLGVSKKTLYKVYTDKDAMVTDFVKLSVEKSRLDLKSRMTREETEIKRLSIFNGFIVNRALEAGPMFFYDIRKYYPAAYKLIKRYKHELIIMLNDLFVKGQQTGIYRNFDTMLLAELRINVLEWDIMEADQTVESLESRQNQLFDLILNGLKKS